MNPAERYRDQAEWARANAARVKSRDLQQQWLDLARQYDKMAAEEGKDADSDRPPFPARKKKQRSEPEE